MKQIFNIIIFSALLLLIPAIIFIGEEPSVSESAYHSGAASDASPLRLPYQSGFFKLLDASTGKITVLSSEEYLIGAVFGEMPVSFEPEALKAQAIAAFTYAVRRKISESSSPAPELKGADFSNDSTKYQAYFSPKEAKEFYGDEYEAGLEKITAAVKAVEGELIIFENEPIIAAFHSMSSGKTESAKNVWGQDISYLTPVESQGDVLADNYIEEKTFTPAELSARLTESIDGVSLPEEKEGWIIISSHSESGTVLSLCAGGINLTGARLREILSLRSACFDCYFDGEEFHFLTRGSGHGVGMSQYGANAMALQGKGYEEIILHYYPGTSIMKIY